MGANMVRRLARGGHQCVVYDRNAAAVAEVSAQVASQSTTGAASLEDFVRRLAVPRAIWLMLPAAVTDRAIADLVPLLAPGDILIDGGNTHYIDDIRRAKELAAAKLHYVDVGTSGGVFGLERGYCLMIGGEPETVARLDPIFKTLAPGRGDIARTPGREAPSANPGTSGASAGETSTAETSAGNASTSEQGYLHCGPAGAGHFVKMVHNGIEYGLMAAYAEGFNILQHANAGASQREADAETTPLREPEHYRYELPLADIAEVWRRGSVVASWLLDLTAAAFAQSSTLEEFSGRVSDSGEGRWTLQAAVDTSTPAPVLSAALFERFRSRGEGDFAGKILSAMRYQFGGHAERKPGT